MMKILFSCIFGLFVVVGLAWFFAMNELAMSSYFSPRQEQIRVKTFEQSKAYNQGMIQELQNMQFEYIKSDETAKKALAPIILHRAADFDESRLPSDLAIFIRSLK